MFAGGRRRADALVVALAVAGICILTVAWTAFAGDDDPSGAGGALLGAEVIPDEPRDRVRDEPVFVEDFEHGFDQWAEVGSASITDLTAAEGQHSATLTSTACRGDAFSRPVPVDAGSTYRLRTSYRTEGDGGYIGLELYDGDGAEVGEQWLIGDGGFPTYDDVRWRYQVDAQDPADLASWARYSTTYVVPQGVAAVAVKIEDWGCGGLPDDPTGAPVHFDRIRLTPAR